MGIKINPAYDYCAEARVPHALPRKPLCGRLWRRKLSHKLHYVLSAYNIVLGKVLIIRYDIDATDRAPGGANVLVSAKPHQQLVQSPSHPAPLPTATPHIQLL